MRDKVFEKARIRILALGEEEIDAELLYDFVTEAEYKIKIYCYIDVIPFDLLYTWANIVRDYYMYVTTYNRAKNQGNSDTGDIEFDSQAGNVRNVKEGDTTIEFFDKKNADNYASAYLNARKRLDLEDFIYRYIDDLRQFRRVKW